MAQILEDNKLDAQSNDKLQVDLQDALQVGQLQVRVTDHQDPAQPILGADVQAFVGAALVAQGATDRNGDITLEINFDNVPLLFPKLVKVTAASSGFMAAEQTVAAIALATIDVILQLDPQ